jgi:small-conductance mechanosensitive channel
LMAYIFGLSLLSGNQDLAALVPLIALAFLLIACWSGVVIGLPKWLVLRQSLQSVWWWILAMIVPGAIASSFWVMTIVSAQFVPSADLSGVLTYLAIASFAVQSLAYGVVQGVSLCACRRKVEQV